MDVKTSGAINPQVPNFLSAVKDQDDHRQTSVGKQETAPAKDVVRLGETASLKSVGTANTIESLQNRMNQIGVGVQKTSNGLNKTAAAISQMAAIVKNFPPFPKDESTRQQALLSCISLAKEIRQMTVPQPPPSAYEKVKSQWEGLFTPDGKISPDALPNIDVSSSDADVRRGGMALDTTGEKIASLSKGMAQALGQ